MSEVFDTDELLDATNEPFKAKVGGQVLDFQRYGQMSPADRKKMKPLIKERESLFREAGLLVKTLDAGEDSERSFVDINDEIHDNQVAQLLLACSASAAAKKKISDLPPNVVENLYTAYSKRTELGEASSSSAS